LNPTGLSHRDILARLKKTHFLDKKYSEGKILCSMCTQPLPIAKKAYEMFFETNLGDPGLFPGAAQLEKEVILQLAALLNHQNATGLLVSGGTEANLLALLAARNIKKTKKPELVLAESAHFSFSKICNILKIAPIFAEVDSCCRVDPFDVEKKITKDTVAIVGTAGTAELGVIDPIDKLSDISMRRNVWLHVDAAFGGLVLPFLAKPHTPFDFSLRGVKSITVDPHKMGMAPIPTGGLFFRERSSLECIKTQTPYLTEKNQHTFIGTRTGASAASTWAVFNLLGVAGFQRITSSCMRNTQLLMKELKKQGFKIVVDPKLNILAFQSKDSKGLAEKMISRGWFVSYVPRYDCIRVIVMPHVKRRHILAFVKDLETEKL
jgi:tyrosine decarboxylase/aspartate 1-decarboxylase